MFSKVMNYSHLFNWFRNSFYFVPHNWNICFTVVPLV